MRSPTPLLLVERVARSQPCSFPARLPVLDSSTMMQHSFRAPATQAFRGSPMARAPVRRPVLPVRASSTVTTLDSAPLKEAYEAHKQAPPSQVSQVMAWNERPTGAAWDQ